MTGRQCEPVPSDFTHYWSPFAGVDDKTTTASTFLGLGDIELTDYRQEATVSSATNAWLSSPAGRAAISLAAESMRDHPKLKQAQETPHDLHRQEAFIPRHVILRRPSNFSRLERSFQRLCRPGSCHETQEEAQRSLAGTPCNRQRTCRSRRSEI
ncbi:hypothetical protein HD554DRAFT_1527582 [Boletus coccyginus]|nr:hypothetical protein HD554DRAFT_1527582 [Boletus coccyginus]